MLDKSAKPLVVDTMPFADSYSKNHIPGALNFEFPIAELSQLDSGKMAEFEKR